MIYACLSLSFLIISSLGKIGADKFRYLENQNTNVEDRLPFPDYADGNCSDVDSVMSVNLGYYQSWAKWRDDSCYPVRAADIDVIGNGYTHLAYTFASINSTFHLEPWASNYAGEIPLYEEFNALKETYPGLRTLIAIGGWTFSDPGETEYRFSDAALTAESRKVFAESCVDFCRRYNFDGIDLDWEYPGDLDHGGRVEDYETFPLLVQEIRDAFDSAGKDDWIITIATPVSKLRLSEGYNLPKLAQPIDFFHIMTYNIFSHFQYSRKIGANTDMRAIFGSIRYYNKQGVSPDKIVMGLATFGRTFQLQDPSCDTRGCFFSGPGVGGCAGAEGTMPYFTIEEYIQSGNYQALRFNPTSLTMELVVSQDLFISYDDPDTFAIKIEFASLSCFRGIMWWAVDLKKQPIPIESYAPSDELVETSAPSPNLFSISPESSIESPLASPSLPTPSEVDSPALPFTKTPSSSPFQVSVTPTSEGGEDVTRTPSLSSSTSMPNGIPSKVPSLSPSSVSSIKPTANPIPKDPTSTPSLLPETESPIFNVPTPASGGSQFPLFQVSIFLNIFMLLLTMV